MKLLQACLLLSYHIKMDDNVIPLSGKSVVSKQAAMIHQLSMELDTAREQAWMSSALVEEIRKKLDVEPFKNQRDLTAAEENALLDAIETKLNRLKAIEAWIQQGKELGLL